RELLEEMEMDRPIISLSNGIDLTFFDAGKGNGDTFRRNFSIQKETKIVLSTGHYIERKGIIDFVELAKQLPDYAFIWLGHTNLNIVPKHVREAVQTKLPNLYFPGFVSQDTLRDALSAADLFLFLTHEETEG